MTCASCGAEIDAGKRFCPNCGARQEPATPATVVLPPGEAPAPPPAQPEAPAPPPAQPEPTLVLPPAPAPLPQTARLEPPPGGPYQQPGYAQPEPPRPRALSGAALWGLIAGLAALSLAVVVGCTAMLIFFFRQVPLGEEAVVAEATVVTEPEATPRPTRTPRPEATARPPEPTAAADGSAGPGVTLATGEILFEEDFDVEILSSFTASEDDSSRYSFEDGGYVIEVKPAETIVWSLADGEFSGSAIRLDTAFESDDGQISAGVIFNFQDRDNFYLFNVSNDGFYSLEMVVDNEWTTLIDWTETDLLQAAGETNELRVELVESEILLFLNGELLDVASDSTFTSGQVGIAAVSFNEGGGVVRFDNLVVQALE